MLVTVKMIRHSLSLPWIAALGLQVILAWILLVKRIWHRFPLFFAYASANFLFGLSCFIVYNLGRPFAYFVAYWLNEGLGLILGLAVVFEIFNHLFAPYPALRKMARLLLRITVLSLVVLGCLVAFTQPVGEHTRIVAAFYIVEETVRILEVGLLAFLFLFATAFGLHWKQYVFGTALGLGVFTAVKLVAVMMRVQFGIAAGPTFNLVQMISFHFSMIIWISYLLAPELAAAPSEMPKRAQLEQWNRAIMELIYQ